MIKPWRNSYGDRHHPWQIEPAVALFIAFIDSRNEAVRWLAEISVGITNVAQ